MPPANRYTPDRSKLLGSHGQRPWFKQLNYSPTWRGVASNDSLAYFLLMLIIALVFRITSGTTPGGPHHGPGNYRMAEVS